MSAPAAMVKRKTLVEVVNPSFMVDDENDNHQEDGLDETDENWDDNSDEDDCFDFVCAFCDNGGDLTMCDGICMRAFHATVEDGEDSHCESLGFTFEDVEAIKDIPFICKNCQYKRHQCFSCGKLGSSDESSFPEVFCCANGACGLFYHPSCVAKLLHPADNKAAEELQLKITAGEQFACPIHRCHACKELEVRSIEELQFAVCRRCPRAYHRKCLPREIASEEDADPEHGIIQRAWEGLLPKRILIYCLDHEIDPDILTPDRDHIKFPGPQREKKNKVPLESSKDRVPLLGKIISAKPPKGVYKVPSSSKQGSLSRRDEELRAVRSSKMQKDTNKNYLGKLKEPTTDERETSLGSKLYSTFYAMDSGKGGNVQGEHGKTQKVKPIERRINNSFTLDADSKHRILKLMNGARSSLSLEQDKERHKAPSTHTHHAKFLDNITLGKVEGSVQSLRAALRKLEGGGSIRDAKMVCGSDLLVQMLRWKERLRGYLFPFFHGTRYTSFGRHFTKIDKLKEIVDMLHWYVQDDDMLVDFCCGSNDFSCLMKKKLDEMGRRCSFKNYDLHQAKNDFNFELRDWYDVRPDELPDGSQLVMGLNPPFGFNASHANKFINKALEFKPKLLILIVPRETERLDKKAHGYDLIWEDAQMFAGNSFYLPGSIDTNDDQVDDWNVVAPILSLWSHPSCTSKHRAIAEQHGHLSKQNHPKANPNKSSGKRKRKKQLNSSISLEDEPASKRVIPRHLSPYVADRKPLDITHSPKFLKDQLQVHSGFTNYSSYQPCTYAAPAAGYNVNETVDDVVRRYSMTSQSSYMGEMNDEFNFLNQRSTYPLHRSPPPFTYPGSSFPGGANPNYREMNSTTSAMQRYAPRSDNSNQGQPPPPPPPHLHDAATPMYHDRYPRPTPSSLRFDPGPYRPYSQHNSSGWLND